MKIPGTTSSASTPGKSRENFELFIMSPGFTARMLIISSAISLAVSFIPAMLTLDCTDWEISSTFYLFMFTNLSGRPPTAQALQSIAGIKAAECLQFDFLF